MLDEEIRDKVALFRSAAYAEIQGRVAHFSSGPVQPPAVARTGVAPVKETIAHLRKRAASPCGVSLRCPQSRLDDDSVVVPTKLAQPVGPDKPLALPNNLVGWWWRRSH